MSNTAYWYQVIANARETIRVAEKALKAENPKPSRKVTAEKVVASRRARITKKTAAQCAK